MRKRQLTGADASSLSESSQCRNIWSDIIVGAGVCFWPVWSSAFVYFYRDMTWPNHARGCVKSSAGSEWGAQKQFDRRRMDVDLSKLTRSNTRLRLSFRKSAMVLKSGASLSNSQITSTLYRHSASSTRSRPGGTTLSRNQVGPSCRSARRRRSAALPRFIGSELGGNVELRLIGRRLPFLNCSCSG